MKIKNFAPILYTTAIFASATIASGGEQTSFTFNFGEKSKSGWLQIAPTNFYSPENGFGFEPGATIVAEKNSESSASPFYFSVKLPEGNYKVTAILGGENKSTTTVKAELRRLMLEKNSVAAGKSVEKTFIVNLRVPQIGATNHVHLKSRETSTEIWDWDEKLTLEFNGENPSLRALEIQPAKVPTVFLMGDSTVCDQPAEPWNSWGQMLPRFFKPEIAIANHSESGETVADSLRAQRFEKIFSLMKSGDYLFVQFGHNDMKNHATNALDIYKSDLQKIVARTRALGGTPVLVTSMERKGGVEHDTLAGYPDAVREVAKEENCPLIDLNAMSRIFYHALGVDIGKAFQDGTHHNNYGSYELAKCVVEGIKQDKLPLAKSIANDFGNFDPAHPDDVNTFEMAVSPNASKEKPLGN
jgi:lysophospholipase L1-like esterase